MTREGAIRTLRKVKGEVIRGSYIDEVYDMAIEALEAVPQSEQYKKGFEDAKRAFLVEYARESENMRKRIAQLEVMLNAQKAISANRPRGEWIEPISYDGLQADYYICSKCRCMRGQASNFCPNCGSDMRGEDE